MLIASKEDLIPFVTEEETGYCRWEASRVPTELLCDASRWYYSSSLRVVNMNSGKNSAVALSFNPLVKRILLNRSVAKRLSAIRNHVRQNMRLVSKEAKRNKLAKKSIVAERVKLVEEKLHRKVESKELQSLAHSVLTCASQEYNRIKKKW
jgi:hypothetical protein